MGAIISAEEFLDKKYSDFESLDNGNIWVNVENLMIEYANLKTKYHLEAQLKAILEKVSVITCDVHGQDTCDIDENSIVNAYPLNNIK